MSDEATFKRAADHISSNSKLKLSTDQKLSIYALFKQATVGACNIPKPGLLDMSGRAKWNAWAALGEMPTDVARERYIATVKSFDPTWNEHAEPAPAPAREPKQATVRSGESWNREESDSEPEEEEEDAGGGGKAGFNLGLCISTLSAEKEEDISDERKTIFDWCKEGNVDKVVARVSEGADVSQKDAGGLTLLHWACDRGHLAMVQGLLRSGADINAKDDSDLTPIDYAAMCEHKEIVDHLLAKGSLPPSV